MYHFHVLKIGLKKDKIQQLVAKVMEALLPLHVL